jgi:hypothetical protein
MTDLRKCSLCGGIITFGDLTAERMGTCKDGTRNHLWEKIREQTTTHTMITQNSIFVWTGPTSKNLFPGQRVRIVDNLSHGLYFSPLTYAENEAPIYRESNEESFLKVARPMSVPESTPLVTFSSGASSSRVPRLDLIPRRALNRIALRFEEGITKHKERAWNARQNPQALQDKEFLIARCVHAIHHALRLIDKLEGRPVPNPEDDDAAALGWAGICLTEATESKQE